MSQELSYKYEFEKELRNKLSLKSKGRFSEETTLLKAFKFTDLSDSGFVNPDCFLRTLMYLGVNIVNKDNVLDYFNLYDRDRTGRINYRDFITEVFTPLEMKRRKIMEEEPNEVGDRGIPQKKEKRKYNLTSTGFRQKIEQNLDKNAKLIKKLKKEILNQGSNTLFDIQKTLLKFDVDNSGRIDMDEFNRICYEFDIKLIPDEIKTIFSCFDPSRTGKIYYDDLLNIVHGTLNDFRAELVDDLYNKFNKNNRGNLEIKTIFTALNDKKIGPEAAEDFKDNFLSHHDFFSKGKTEVSYEELIDFFEILSVDFKEDQQFEDYINNTFSPQKPQERDNRQKNYDEEEGEYNNKAETKEFLDSLEKLRDILLQQGATGIIELLRNLKNVDLDNSNGIDLDEFITVIQNVLENSNASFPVREIQNIFNVYDLQEKGNMEYKLFLNDLLKLKLMPKSRKEHIQNIYNHLDFEGKQVLDINELTALYKKPENDPVPDLLDSFVTFHNIVRGNRNPLVTINDFVKYYTYINILIPETKHDKLFIDSTSESWLLYDKSFDERKNLAKIRVEGLGKQKNREAMNKLIRSNKTPYGTIKDKINYNLNEQNPTVKYNIDKKEDLLGHLRAILADRGYTGIMSIRRTFMLIDENSSKKITFDQFENIFKKFRFDLSEEEVNRLFNYFDKSGSGFIDYDEFVNGVCSNLNKFRRDVLKQVFHKLDNDEKGYVTVYQLRHEYNPTEHPLVRQGKRGEDEVLAEFLDVLEYHFNLLIEKNDDDSDVNDIKVDFDDFCDFYKNISVCIDDDKYFEVMVLSEWGIKKEGKTLYQKTWNQQDA
jgi:Ca2+-binding EF-hand superfamily protein